MIRWFSVATASVVVVPSGLIRSISTCGALIRRKSITVDFGGLDFLSEGGKSARKTEQGVAEVANSSGIKFHVFRDWCVSVSDVWYLSVLGKERLEPGTEG
jgi:hypothetical protein